MARRLPIDGGNSPPASTSSGASPLDALIASFADLDADQLRLQWRNHLGGTPPAQLPRWLLARVLAQRLPATSSCTLKRAIVGWPYGNPGNGILRPETSGYSSRQSLTKMAK
jgi:hypothetical protein